MFPWLFIKMESCFWRLTDCWGQVDTLFGQHNLSTSTKRSSKINGKVSSLIFFIQWFDVALLRSYFYMTNKGLRGSNIHIVKYLAFSLLESYHKYRQEVMFFWIDYITEMKNLTSHICWELVKKEGYIAIWQKSMNNTCYLSRDIGVQPPICDSNDNPDEVWYIPNINHTVLLWCLSSLFVIFGPCDSLTGM